MSKECPCFLLSVGGDDEVQELIKRVPLDGGEDIGELHALLVIRHEDFKDTKVEAALFVTVLEDGVGKKKYRTKLLPQGYECWYTDDNKLLLTGSQIKRLINLITEVVHYLDETEVFGGTLKAAWGNNN